MKIIISSLFYWPKQIFWPGNEADAKTSVTIGCIGFILSCVAVACGPTITIVAFITAWIATILARHEIDRGDAYRFDSARRANAAYMVGGIGWMFRATTVILVIVIIGWHHFFK